MRNQSLFPIGHRFFIICMLQHLRSDIGLYWHFKWQQNIQTIVQITISNCGSSLINDKIQGISCRAVSSLVCVITLWMLDCINNNSKIIMMKYVSIVLLIIIVSSQGEQKFAYISNETLTIQVNSLLQVSLSLTTASDEQLSQATVQAILKINQRTSIFYNLIYFDNQTPAGQQCYQNWIISNNQLATSNCSKYDPSKGNLPACMNFTNCQYEDIKFTLQLSEQLYRQSFILIQNSDSNTDLVLQTQIRMELSSQNTWFYWGVGLTCFLLISLVIYSGIIFYWMLKYKRMKKMFEQFKLTEEQEQIKKGN